LSTNDHVGVLNLIGAFEAFAARLLVAVDQGRILHATKNIRDSGAPLEQEFRAFLSSRLPAPFRVRHGYIYDVESRCSPQIDVIITDAEQEIAMLGSGEDAQYLPFTATYVIGEIKGSATAIDSHLDQLGTRVDAFWEMNKRLKQEHSDARANESLFSLLLVGDASKADYEKILAHHRDNSKRLPGCIVFLNTQEVISCASNILDSEYLSFSQYGPYLWIYGPATDEYGKGKVLLWLFYRIVYHLQRNAPGRGMNLAFAEAMLRDHKLARKAELGSS
jgi:hypothetical protein